MGGVRVAPRDLLVLAPDEVVTLSNATDVAFTLIAWSTSPAV